MLDFVKDLIYEIVSKSRLCVALTLSFAFLAVSFAIFALSFATSVTSALLLDQVSLEITHELFP